MTLVDDRRPADPTHGELSRSEWRALVRSVADQVGERVAGDVATGGDVTREQVRSATVVADLLDAENRRRVGAGLAPLSAEAQVSLRNAVIAHVYGLGELEHLWRHPDVENIDINGHDVVWVSFAGGERTRWEAVAGSEAELIDLIRRAARRLSLNEVEFDARHPQLDLQLPDGSRLFAVFGGRTGNGVATAPLLSLRRHRRQSVTSVHELDLMPAGAADFVVADFAAGGNLIVAGDHNAGKTTTLRALCAEAIRPHQRVVTVEAFITELGLDRLLPNVATLYSRGPSSEGDGEITVEDLIRRATRRLNPTRVIVGEVLGDEVGAVLDVFSGSTRGSACTIHARSARGVVRRFEQYGLGARRPVPVEAINYAMAEAAPLIVHLTGDESRAGSLRRYCTSIVEVTGLEAGRVAMTELWADGPRGLEPRHPPSAARRERLERNGWNWSRNGWVTSGGAR